MNTLICCIEVRNYVIIKFVFFLSAGYSKLHKKRDRVIKCLADQGFVRELVEKLWSAQMITRRIYDEAKNYAPGVVERDRATVLFNAVLSSVELNPAKYGKFIVILGEIHGSQDLVAFIEGNLRYIIVHSLPC